jgi:hypoxanthine phosphoribosyltransferase
MNLPITGVLKDLSRVMLTPEQISARIREMAEAISADYADRELTVLALMDGALFFVADLLRGVDLPIHLFTLSASSYHGGTQSTGEVRVAWPEGVSFEGRHVLVLDDILDTGLTLNVIRDHILTHQPASLKIGVLLAKKRERLREVPADYVGFEIEDEFVVGYGMDYNGRFRNLPCIGILNP